MSARIDFTRWTTAQLRVGARYAIGGPDDAALFAELATRERDGTLDDGSEARIAALRAAGQRKARRS